MSFGEELRRERELRQISLREVAEATKVNIRYLEAMERNDFAHLPGGVFNRGFVRAYAQFIGVDPEAMVNAYILEERTQTDPPNEAAPAAPTMMRGVPRTASRAAATPPTRPAAARAIPSSPTLTIPEPVEASRPRSATFVRYGLLIVATGILAVFGYLVWDVLRDPTLPRFAARSTATVVSAADE